MKSIRFIKVWECEFIADIDPIHIKKMAKCDCGETYALIYPNDELIVCDKCAEIQNEKSIK
jgi:hypothetical protein